MYISKAKRIFDKDNELCYYIGEYYRASDKLNSAIKEYSCAIALGKANNADAAMLIRYYFNRGVCYLKQEILGPSYADFSEVLRLNPYYSNALVNRGICLYKMKKTQEACADWRKSVAQGNPTAKGYLAKYDKK